jgi:preprotein translocase subunit SecF
MDIIAKRKIFLGFSGILVVLSLISLMVWGLKRGIDLEGGTDWQIAFPDKPVTVQDIQQALSATGLKKEFVIRQLTDQLFSLRFKDLSEEEKQQYFSALQKVGDVKENNFSRIGPTIGFELRRKAIWGIAFVLLGISIYIAWAFRKVSEPVKSWKYGVVTLITLFHDVVIPTGMLSVLGRFRGVEIDTNFIVALLVVMGFSVHDTIVVFDRIRENLLHQRGKKIALSEVINQSIKETFARSINTSLTLVLVLIALMIFGPTSLFYFILVILVGTIFGTYSSIFVASPLLYLWGRSNH